MRAAGFTAMEVLAVLALVSAFYAFVLINFDARSRTAEFDASVAQGRLWADDAEIARRSGVLQPGTAAAVGVALAGRGAAPARTPFGGAYRVAATHHAAVVSFDVPFEARGGGVFAARGNSGGGTVHLAPGLLAPTTPMQEKVLLYRGTVR